MWPVGRKTEASGFYNQASGHPDRCPAPHIGAPENNGTVGKLRGWLNFGSFLWTPPLCNGTMLNSYTLTYWESFIGLKPIWMKKWQNPLVFLQIKILDFLRSGFCPSATTTKIVCLTWGTWTVENYYRVPGRRRECYGIVYVPSLIGTKGSFPQYGWRRDRTHSNLSLINTIERCWQFIAGFKGLL